MHFRWFIYLIIITALPLVGNTQDRAVSTSWTFEGGAILDFQYAPPQVRKTVREFWLGNGASISGEGRPLLFYSNGDSIWSGNNMPMLGGSGLNSSVNPLYTVSAIVPHPGDGQLYYVFKLSREHDNLEPSGLNYSIVDMAKDNGMGEVIFKQHEYVKKCLPLVTVSLHANEQSYWIIIHGWNNEKFYAIPITKGGIGTPVISTIGPSYAKSDEGWIARQIKVSPDGTRLSVAQAGSFKEGQFVDGFVHLYDFNSKTGELSNFRNLPTFSTGGVEFSPSSQILYASAYFISAGEIKTGIDQFNIALEDSNIARSRTPIALIARRNEIGDLQLGPDGKIYCANGGSQFDDHMPVINFPNRLGPACSFTAIGINFSELGCPSRLPIFVQSIFRESPSIADKSVCRGQLTPFEIVSPGYADSVSWRFGDGYDSTILWPKGKSLIRAFSKGGVVPVEVTKYVGEVSRVLKAHVTVVDPPLLQLASDTTICSGEKLTLKAGGPGYNYLWHSGETTPSLEVTLQGWYKVTVDNDVCAITDSVRVDVNDFPRVSLGPDRVICEEGAIRIGISENQPGYTYQWNTGEVSSMISIEETGDYRLVVQHGRCASEDIVSFLFAPITLPSFPNTFNLEFGEALEAYSPGSNIDVWNWDFGDGNHYVSSHPFISHTYTEAGTYAVQLLAKNQHGCQEKSTFQVTLPLHLFIPNIITPNGDNLNDVFEIQYNGAETKVVRIVDRWGRQVFVSAGCALSWDGGNVSSGVYYYVVNLGKAVYKGSLHVVR
jgi:gliding motility-associated-like protein